MTLIKPRAGGQARVVAAYFSSLLAGAAQEPHISDEESLHFAVAVDWTILLELRQNEENWRLDPIPSVTSRK